MNDKFEKPLTQVMIIGIDGGEPELLERWIASGDLPNIARLKSNSLSGRTRNPYALEAGAVWPAFHTGLNPGNQPQYDGQRFFDTANYSFRWFEADKVKPNLWQHLSSQGKRCLVIDAPYVRLDPALNGSMILDWGVHVAADGMNIEFQTHPPGLKDELLSVIGPDPTHGKRCDSRKLESLADYETMLSEYLLRIEKKADMTAYMLAKGGWDFAETVFTDLHCLGHHFWHIRDESHPQHNARMLKALGDPLLRAFRALDTAIGKILDVLDSRTTVLFYLSHGMGPQYTGTGLLDKLLSIIERGKPAGWADRPMKARVRQAWRKVPGGIRARLRGLRKPVAGMLDTTEIDLDRSTRQFFEVHANNATGGVRLNLKGREVNGKVDPQDAPELLKKLKRSILDVKNADTGEPIASDCIITSDVYTGQYESYLPDMLVVWNRSAPIRRVESPEVGTVRQDYGNFRTGDHTPAGAFMASGQQIGQGQLDGPVDVVDFFSTMTAILGVDSAETDGQPISAMVNEDVRTAAAEPRPAEAAH